ncbi:3D domain-containing protein [Mucisphaera sp.]|uniref:3D domain-containing protein n=1 Tax=Mucisphaera sp. TaxID=2913024 RepID=UPI003D0B2E03
MSQPSQLLNNSFANAGAEKLSRLQRRIRRTWMTLGIAAAAMAGLFIGAATAVLLNPDQNASGLTLLAIDKEAAALAQAQHTSDEPELTEEDLDLTTHLLPVDTDPGTIEFAGKSYRLLGEVEMTVTAYSPDERSCGPWNDGFTASGYSVWTNGMRLVAADTRLLPFGTVLTIPGYNNEQPVQVLDRGGAIKGYRLDVLFATHEAAIQWGVRKIRVGVWADQNGSTAALPITLLRTGG